MFECFLEAGMVARCVNHKMVMKVVTMPMVLVITVLVVVASDNDNDDDKNYLMSQQ